MIIEMEKFNKAFMEMEICHGGNEDSLCDICLLSKKMVEDDFMSSLMITVLLQPHLMPYFCSKFFHLGIAVAERKILEDLVK